MRNFVESAVLKRPRSFAESVRDLNIILNIINPSPVHFLMPSVEFNIIMIYVYLNISLLIAFKNYYPKPFKINVNI